jgi:hypothetical protein
LGELNLGRDTAVNEYGRTRIFEDESNALWGPRGVDREIRGTRFPSRESSNYELRRTFKENGDESFGICAD